MLVDFDDVKKNNLTMKTSIVFRMEIIKIILTLEKIMNEGRWMIGMYEREDKIDKTT